MRLMEESGDDEVASSYASSTQGKQHNPGFDVFKRSEQCEEDAYGEDDFEEYSDEFELEESETNNMAHTSHGVPLTPPIPSEELRVGVSVQVYWEEYSQWFDGRIASLESDRRFVIYDDGDQQWEPLSMVRPAPSDLWKDLQQLQLLQRALHEIIGARVIAFWRDEGEWFAGFITNAADTLVHIKYDDGDEQCVSETDFQNLMVQVPIVAESMRNSDECEHETANTNGRILTARKYTPAVANHFEPARIARPYRSLLQTHLGSVVNVRPGKSSFSRPFNAPVKATLEFRSVTSGVSDTTRDCQVQAEVTTETLLQFRHSSGHERSLASS